MGHKHSKIDPMVEHRALAELVEHVRKQPSIVDDDYPEWAYRYDQLKFGYVEAVKSASPERFRIQVR